MGGSSTTTGWNYQLAWWDDLCLGPLDAALEFRGADKVAWKGRQTTSGVAVVNKPNLWGGDKDQGGAVGRLRWMFGEAGQVRNSYLVSIFGPKITARRGIATAAWEGGTWGANNPYQQKRSYRVERIVKGWDDDDCWYPETAPVPLTENSTHYVPGVPYDPEQTRWIFRLAGATSWAQSPDGIDWTNPTTLSGGWDSAFGVTRIGTKLVWYHTSGAVLWSDWTTPTTMTEAGSVGYVPFYLSGSAINGSAWFAKHGVGVYYQDDLTAAPIQVGDATTMVFGNETWVVRYNSSSHQFKRATQALARASSWTDGTTLELSGDPGDHDYQWYTVTADASPLVTAVAGSDYHNQAFVWRSLDGFASKSLATLPAGTIGQIVRLFHVEGTEWLALITSPATGHSGILRSLNDCESFEDVADGVGLSPSGEIARDPRNGRVLLVALNDGGQLWQSDDRVNWTQREYSAAYPPATLVCVAPEQTASEPPPYATGRYAKNPAHMILFAHTQYWAGRQARELVDLDQLHAAADWYYARGFGLCTRRKRKEESPGEFIRRIEKVAGCSFTLGLDDGLWHLDIANGEYDIDSLPIITDDDVLSFKETKTTLDDAVNSVSIQYFDPERNEKVITPPVRAMGLIAQFGEIHQTLEFPEIPIGYIATMVATRELLARITPGGMLELDVMPWWAALRKNQYVRVQMPKRGIADAVFLVGEVKPGKLKSGAVSLKLGQDIYSLPDTVYGGIELGEDTRPPTEAAPIVHQRVFEAGYIDVVANMPAADFAALPADASYLVGTAVNPGRMRNFTMTVAPDGGDYDDVGDGEFCPSCTSAGLVEPGLQEGIGFNDPVMMASVQVHDLGLWDNELVRVDAIDLDAGTLDLGRGCGHTLPEQHAAGSRIYFYQHSAAYDRTQHIAGEALNVKLLTNSFSEQMDPDDATAVDVTVEGLLACPYPPGDYRINGVSIYAIGTATPGTGGTGGTPGAGGGSVPTSPPANGPNGAPASGGLGPNGGYPDDAPYPIPQPEPDDLDDEQIDGGDFGDAGDIDGWRKQDGSALDSRWAIADGKLRFHGVAGVENIFQTAYYFAGRFSLPWMPLPRYKVTITAKVQCDPSTKVRVGVALGYSNAGVAPGPMDATTAATYPAEAEITHVFEWAPQGASATAGGEGVIVNFTPAICVIDETGAVVTATFDDVSMVIEAVPIPATDAVLDHLNFDAGLTGWTIMPTPGAFSPSVTVSGGTVTMTPTSEYGLFVHLICDAPVTDFDAVGKYIGPGGEVWCNDDTIYGGMTWGGVAFGYAYKHVTDGFTGGVITGAYQRGDFTERRAWIRPPLVSGDYTLHYVVSMRCKLGASCKVRNPSMPVTNAVVD